MQKILLKSKVIIKSIDTKNLNSYRKTKLKFPIMMRPLISMIVYALLD
jgi:hypothetical protein